MTLVIGLKTRDGIIITADSRASATIYNNDTVQKIFQLSENCIIGIAGDGGLAIHFLDQIKNKLVYEEGATDLAEQIHKIGKSMFNDYYEHIEPEKRPLLQLILLGRTKESELEIYTFKNNDNFIPRKCMTGFACIGVPFIADYLLNRLYEKDIRIIGGKDLSIWCMKETSSQDKSVGGPIHVAIFSNNKPFAKITGTEINLIEKKIENIHLGQKSLFYPEDPGSGADLIEPIVTPPVEKKSSTMI